MTEKPLVGAGAVERIPDRLTFTGWLEWDPADPKSWPYISLAHEDSQWQPGYSAPGEGRVVRPVRVTVHLEAQ